MSSRDFFNFQKMPFPVELSDYVIQHKADPNFGFHAYYLSSATKQGWNVRLMDNGFFMVTNSQQQNRSDLIRIKLRGFPHSDIEAFGQVMLNDHFRSFIDHLVRLNGSNPILSIIDGGAYVGLSSIFFKREFPHAHILAVEPDINNLFLLEENCTMNDMVRTTVMHRAIWNTDIQLDISSQFRDGREWTRQVFPANNGSVTGISLAELTDMFSQRRTVDILKLDVEGSEFTILDDLHTQKLLRQHIRFLCLEIHEEMGCKNELIRMLSGIFELSQGGEHSFGHNKFLD